MAGPYEGLADGFDGEDEWAAGDRFEGKVQCTQSPISEAVEFRKKLRPRY